MAATTTIDAQSQRVETINVIFKVLHHVSPYHGGAGADHLPDNGRNYGSITNVSGVAEAVYWF